MERYHIVMATFDQLVLLAPLRMSLPEDNPNGGSGIEDCPVCGGHELEWHIAEHYRGLWMRCRTVGCVMVVE